MRKTLISFAAALALAAPVASGHTQLIDKGWQFRLAADTAGQWRDIDLPHDWSIEHDFDRSAPAGNDGGYLPTGRGVYRKTVRSAADGKLRMLYLEGAYMNAGVKVNGVSAGCHPYGYSSVIHDITPLLREGENEIEIDVDNSAQKNSRWYTGSGIYRHVWLITKPVSHIRPQGIFVTTPDADSLSATVNVSVETASPRPGMKIAVRLRHDGLTVAETTAGADTVSNLRLTVARPALWSPSTPSLYTAEVALTDGGETVDEETVTFGIRKFEFSAAKGLLLNGSPLNLYGGCVHHDNGMLGARSYDAAERRKARLLKEAGFNAVRTSHNPPAPAFLDACDREGLIVVDEAFDGWRDKKTDHDYAQLFDRWWQRDIEAMVRRDRNHPSVFCWSTGNEVIERKKIEVVTTARRLASLCRTLDPTRPVTSALASWDKQWEIYDPLAAEHEITGYNYMLHKAESDHERVPSRVMWQTESYPRDAFKNWETVNDNPCVIGDFVWTAIDYLGESGIGRHYYEGDTEGEHYHRDQWPWHGSYCGDIDITGLRKPISHYRTMLFAPDRRIYMSVREPDGYKGKIKTTLWGTYPSYESWNWKGHEGKPIEIEVVSRYPRVRLYVNGEVAGEAPTGRDTGFKAVFTVPYAQGTVRAAGLNDDGSEGDSAELATAGAPRRIRLTADKTSMTADNQDLVYVTAELVDARGRVVPDADVTVDFNIDGAGDLIATGSADMTDPTAYTATSRKTFRGRAQAVVKSSDRGGRITLTASAPGLQKSKIKLISK